MIDCRYCDAFLGEYSALSAAHHVCDRAILQERIEEATVRAEAAESGAAAMRQSLMAITRDAYFVEDSDNGHYYIVAADHVDGATTALSSDAGCALLAELATLRAQAERDAAVIEWCALESGLDGIEGVEMDRYEYAHIVAVSADREEANREDEIEGFKRMVLRAVRARNGAAGEGK